jgi:putative membrane protein
LEENNKRALILCVDLDDDIGQKTGLETPIVGRKNVLEAAEKLALVDSEEADSNAMFASIRLSDELSQAGYLTEVSVVSGLKDGGLEASRKALNEITQVANMFNPSEVYVVTDGFGEEDVEPVLKARLPLAGVKRVVVKQSRAIEESYIVFGRYLKMLFTDPRFKRWLLGLGGFLITFLTILNYFGSYREVNTAFWVLIGIAILIKGFDLDKWISTGLKQVFGKDLPPILLTLKTLFLFTGLSLILFSLGTGYLIKPLPDEAFIAYVGRIIAQIIEVLLFGVAMTLLSGSIRYPLTASSIQDSLTVLANIMTLAPLIKTLGLAASTPSFDLKTLLYVSLLTLVLVYAVNVLVILIVRLLPVFSKRLKITPRIS